MNIHIKLSLLVIFCLFLHISLGDEEAKCEECGSKSFAYCVDESSYYLCMNGKPMKTKLHKCKDDYVCTNSPMICEKKSEKEPLCSSSCNKCPTDLNASPYTCVSQTKYGRCINNEVALVDSCESGSVCNVEMLNKYGTICAPLCVIDYFGLSPTCKNEQEITTTVAPPTAPNVSSLKNQCMEAEEYGQEVTFYYIANKYDCKTYIYCEKDGNDVQALLMRCAKGYYNQSLKKCTNDRPNTCNTSTTITTPSTTTTTATSNPTISEDP